MEVFEKGELDQLDDLLQVFRRDGVFLVRGLISRQKITELTTDLYHAYGLIRESVGVRALERARESGVVRAPLSLSMNFLDLATANGVLPFVERVVGEHSILHLQNGFILQPESEQFIKSSEVFQGQWHQDFPRFTGKVPISLNVFVCLSPFTKETGATEFLIGSHLNDDSLEVNMSQCKQEFAVAEPGDAVVFDSTLWHRAGLNISGQDRLAVNHQYTFPWIKQQVNLFSFFPDAEIREFSGRVQQLLGFWSRVPGSYGEFYVDPAERLYRAGQG